jgi:hypothetical protein
MRIIIGASLALALTLSGCARAVPAHWAKPGADQTTFMQDRYACIQQSQQNKAVWDNGQNGGGVATVVTSRGMLVSCMAAKGYSLDPNGPLVAPVEANMKLVD